MSEVHKVAVDYLWEPYGEYWNKSVRPGRWMIRTRSDVDVREVVTFFLVDLRYKPDRVRRCLELLEMLLLRGEGRPGTVLFGPDGRMLCEAGHVLVMSDYADDSRVLMTGEEALELCRQLVAVMEHPDYNNPDAVLEPFTIEVIAGGESALVEYYERGGTTPVMPEKYRK